MIFHWKHLKFRTLSLSQKLLKLSASLSRESKAILTVDEDVCRYFCQLCLSAGEEPPYSFWINSCPNTHTDSQINRV